MSTSKIGCPAIPRDLTSAWLTSALRRRNSEQPTVIDASVSPLAEGKGFLTVMAHVGLTYEAHQSTPKRFPASLVAKLQSPDPTARAICAAMGVWERECRFYSEIAPKVPSRVPDAYYVHADAAAGEYLLLLEDLSTMTTVDQIEGATFKQAKLVMKWLGRFHGSCANKAIVDTLNWLPTLEQFFGGMQPQMLGALPRHLELFGDIITPVRAAWISKLLPRFGKELVPSKSPPTLVHTDFRLDNLFFDGEREVVVFDWQSISKGSGIYDVAWFIVGSFPSEVRRAHERELIALYRAALLEQGANPGSVDALFDEYRAHLLNIIAISPIFAMLDSSSERSMALFHGWCNRIFAAADDLNVGALIDG